MVGVFFAASFAAGAFKAYQNRYCDTYAGLSSADKQLVRDFTKLWDEWETADGKLHDISYMYGDPDTCRMYFTGKAKCPPLVVRSFGPTCRQHIKGLVTYEQEQPPQPCDAVVPPACVRYTRPG
jgi:hypothetical protein